MTLSPAQARAARAILHISQSELEAKINIVQSRISNFENPKIDFILTGKELVALENFYLSSGLEFLDLDGVRRRTAGILELKGYDGFRSFIYDVYETVKDGGDVCVSNVDERQFDHWFQNYKLDYMSKIAKVDNLNFRILIKEEDDYFLANAYAAYRLLPAKYFTGVPTYVYGDKKAEILFEEDTVSIFIINNARIADTQRKSFNLAWEQAHDPV